MDKPGPKSGAELEFSPKVVEGGVSTRPEPPPELTDVQQQIWWSVVNSEPVDFFATEAQRGLLSNYCRHMGTVTELCAVIEDFDIAWVKSAEGAKRYNQLLKMRENETRAASSMATKLRMTNQSRYTPQAAATAAKRTSKSPSKVWEFKG